ncbi:unnamed protein product [Blepharisma stoltei]|uniref:Uncharacterized protein n=1 Tax=Blepharisma stoltei TaxID=1481888 RepID=A0AAU9K7D4_9CILI|nr:unnamed protein product [Blepharisma stoltei]
MQDFENAIELILVILSFTSPFSSLTTTRIFISTVLRRSEEKMSELLIVFFISNKNFKIILNYHKRCFEAQ